jgi:hypothetical protein
MSESGCGDNERDDLTDLAQYPDIAACSGRWSIPGLEAPPVCNRTSGDRNQSDATCAAQDLCAKGWHICHNDGDVKIRLGQTCSTRFKSANTFFATDQPGDFGICMVAGSNDIFGCGSIGADLAAMSQMGVCESLDKSSGNECSLLNSAVAGAWQCIDPMGTRGYDERNVVTKPADAGGGVLCCRDLI